MFVGLFNGLVPRLSAVPDGLFVCGYGIIHGQRDVFDTVAVGGHFLSRLVLGRQTRLQNQSDIAPDEAGRKPCPGCRWSDLGTARLGTQSSRRRNTRPAWRCRNRSERGPHRADAMDRWHRFQPVQSLGRV